MSYYQELAAFFTILSVATLSWACWRSHRSKHGMTPKTYTIVSPVGEHASVVLYPLGYGKGVDREGNTYRIHGDAATLIEE